MSYVCSIRHIVTSVIQIIFINNFLQHNKASCGSRKVLAAMDLGFDRSGFKVHPVGQITTSDRDPGKDYDPKLNNIC